MPRLVKKPKLEIDEETSGKISTTIHRADTPASRWPHRGQTPAEATMHSSRRMGRRIFDDGHEISMDAPRQNGWDYGSCPGRMRWGPAARFVNG